MNAKVMAFATTALAVIAGIYVYNEFIKADDAAPAPSGSSVDPNAGAGTGFAGRRRMRR